MRSRVASALVARSLLCAPALLGLSSCAFDTGHDYPVTVTWLINGAAPTRAMCDEQGVDRVRLTVRGPSKTRSLESACDSAVTLFDDQGERVLYGGFTTTESFNYDVTYSYEVTMLGKSGNTVANYADRFQVFYGDEEPWVLNPLELFSPTGTTASLKGAWTIGTQAASVESCQQLGAKEVAIDVASYTDPDFVDYVEIARVPCSDGAIRTQPVLAGGSYWVRFSALDGTSEDNEVASQYLDELYDVNQSGELPLGTVRFER